MLQQTIKAIADPVRRQILELLKDRPQSAGEIVAQFSLTGASISHHLAILKQAGLVNDTKQGKYIVYELNTTVLEEVLLWFQTLRGTK